MGLTVESWLALLILGVALWVAWFHLMGRYLLVTAPVAFIIYQGLNVLGVAIESSRMQVFRSDWPVLVSVGFFLFVMGGVIANGVFRFRPREDVGAWRDAPLEGERGDTRLRWAFVWLMVLVCIAAGFLFYRAVGYNSLLGQLRGLLSGAGVSYTEFSQQRAGVLSDGYRAAGYTLQFIGIILPTLVAYIWVEGVLKQSRALKFVAVALFVACVFFVTIQGGRTYILATLLLIVFLVAQYTSPLPPRFRLSGFATVCLFVGFVLAFGAVSVLQGRAATGGESPSLIRMFIDLWERVGGEYSRTQMVALGVLEPEIPAYGAQWWSQLEIVLPGAPSAAVPFDVRVYHIIYGSYNGNNPLDPWGSYFYNFGVPGLLIVPLVLGFLAQAFVITALFRSRRNAVTVVVITALCYRFMFVIDPYTLLLVGPFTLWFLNWLMGLLGPSDPMAVGSRERVRERQGSSRGLVT